MPIVRVKATDVDLSNVDWDRIDRTTDEEIDAQIAEDEDTAPEFTDEDFKRARHVDPRVKPRTPQG